MMEKLEVSLIQMNMKNTEKITTIAVYLLQSTLSVTLGPKVN